MSIGATLSDLWKNAPGWRYLTIAAGATTVLAVVAGMLSGGGSQPNQNVAQQGGGGSGSQNQGQQGGGQRQPTPPPGTPGNVVIAPQATATPEVKSRLLQFSAAVSGANTQLEQGKRCESLNAAADILKEGDLGFIEDAEKKEMKNFLAAVSQCEAYILASDQRFDALASAHDAWQDDQSADKVQRLADAYSLITPADETRHRADTLAAALKDGERAMNNVNGSDGRLKALTTLQTQVEKNGSNNSLIAFASATQAITPFDLTRMNEAQKRAFDEGQSIIERAGESDERLNALSLALASAKTSNDASSQTRLLELVAELTAFDEARANNTQKQNIADAKAIATSIALDRLVDAAATFDPATSGPKQHEQLASMLRVATERGAPKATTPEQSAAIATARVAEARLKESDRKIDNAQEAAAAWRENPGASLKKRIYAAHEITANPFDVERLASMSAADLETLQNAYLVLEASKVGLSRENVDKIPMYLGADVDHLYKDDAIDALRRRLQSNGFLVVDVREESAVEINITGLETDKSTFRAGSQTIDTATAMMAIAATWTFENRVFFRNESNGRGTRMGAEAQAVENAAGQIFDAFDAYIDKS